MPELYTYLGIDVAREVEVRVGDEANAQYNRDMILAWINAAIRRISDQVPLVEVTAVTNLIAGTAGYNFGAAFPGNRIASILALFVDGRDVEIIGFADLKERVARANGDERAGQPVVAAEFGGILTLWPTPDTTLPNGLTVYATAYPTDLVTISDKLTVPDRFFNAVVDYCYQQALLVDENFEAAQIAGASHDENLRRQRARDTSPSDFYPAIQGDPDEDRLYS